MSNEFLEGELVGINLPRRCKSCNNCPTCLILDDDKSLKEQTELDMLRKGVQHDEDANNLKVSYPFTMDLSLFQDNREQAIKRMESNIRSLTRKGMKQVYDEQIRDYVKRGVLGPVSVQEIEDYKKAGGHVHYVSHHGVLNDHSKSAPLRVVVDSAMKNNYMGPSFNDATVKGTMPSTTCSRYL